MSEKYWVLSILAVIIAGNDGANTPSEDYPQLSTTFLNGYWYEHLFINPVLNDNACSHYKITCNSTTSCEVEHVVWHSYLLIQIWNGTISEDETAVTLTINRENDFSSYEVNLKFQDRTVLIWSGNDSDLEFASVLIRMENDQEMEKIWNEATTNMNYLSIAAKFPAGMWKKIDPTGCVSDGRASFQAFSFQGLGIALLGMFVIQRMLIM